MSTILTWALALTVQVGTTDTDSPRRSPFDSATGASPLERLNPLDPDAPTSPRSERAEWLDPGDVLTWWRYHRHRILDLDAHIHRAEVRERAAFGVGRGERVFTDDLRPDDVWIGDRLIPALLAILEQDAGKDLRAGALLALGRASSGRAELDPRVLETLRTHLRTGNAEVVESAIVALGYVGPPAVATLDALLADGKEGRRLTGGDVSDRWRSWAAYALGLASQRIEERGVLVGVAAALERELLARDTDDELRTACATALGALASAPAHTASSDAEQRELSTSIGAAFERFCVRDGARTGGDAGAHALVPWAAWSATAPEEVQQTLLRHLADALQGSRLSSRGAAVALGRVHVTSESDNESVRAALEIALEHDDRRTRALAWLSLAERARSVPLRARDAELRFARERLARALAVEGPALRGFALVANGLVEHTAVGLGRPPSDATRARLRERFTAADSSELRAAGALSLGLARDIGAAGILSAELAATADDRLRRPLAVALGLIDLRRLEPLHDLLETSLNRTELLESVAVGLVLQRDRTLAPRLAELLPSRAEGGRFRAVVRTLGRVGDGRIVAALLRELERDDRPTQERAALATALGRRAHLGPDPLNERLAPLGPWWSSSSAFSDPPTGTGLVDLL